MDIASTVTSSRGMEEGIAATEDIEGTRADIVESRADIAESRALEGDTEVTSEEGGTSEGEEEATKNMVGRSISSSMEASSAVTEDEAMRSKKHRSEQRVRIVRSFSRF